MVNIPWAAKTTLVSLDAVTSAANMRSSHRGALTHCMGRCVLISPCGHYRRLLLALHRCDFLPSTVLPPVPRRCFAFSASRGCAPLRYHEGSDSYAAHLRRRSPRLLRHTFLSFRLQPRQLPDHRLPPRQRDPRFSDFALESQARRSSPPNRVRYPTDQQFASGCFPPRLAATQLPSATELWLTPTRTFTVLIWRPHGRTIPACARMTIARVSTSSRRCQNPSARRRRLLKSLDELTTAQALLTHSPVQWKSAG